MRVLVGVIALFLTASSACAEPVFPQGSRVGLTPPQGMVLSKRFSGFEDAASGTTILLREWPDATHDRLVEAMSKPDFGGPEMNVLRRETLTIGGRPAFLVTASQPSSSGGRIRKWILAVSDPHLSIMAMAQTPEGRGGYDDARIMDILKTITFWPRLNIEDALAALPYTVGARAGLRLVQVANETASFTDGPSDVFEAYTQPSLTVATAARFASVPPASRKELMRQIALGDPQLKDIVLKSLTGSGAGSVERYESLTTARSSKDGQAVTTLVALLFSRGAVVSVIASTPATRADQDLPRFRSVIDSIAIKP